MKIVIQRVSCASVRVEGVIVGQIQQGLMLLVGVEEGDDKSDAEWLAKKILDLRIFSDSEGKMNLSVKDISGDLPCWQSTRREIVHLSSKQRDQKWRWIYLNILKSL